MAVSSNWNKVKQGVIDEISNHAKNFKTNALNDIKKRIDSNGINSKIDKNGVEYDAKDITEFNSGKVYFDQVFSDIDKQSWVDSL
jgi:hypothetical protein